MSNRTCQALSRYGCSSSNKAHPRQWTMSEIIKDYIAVHRENSKRELHSFEIISSVRKAIKQAGMALSPSGKKFDHQRRLQRDLLERATAILLENQSKIESCDTFDKLLYLVKSTAGKVDGIGELYVYDTSLRIGAKLGLTPNVVYLHCGTREGAKQLGLTTSAAFIRTQDLPTELRELPPYEVEDILCIYKNKFKTTTVDK